LPFKNTLPACSDAESYSKYCAYIKPLCKKISQHFGTSIIPVDVESNKMVWVNNPHFRNQISSCN